MRIAETGAEGTERRDEEERDTENDQKEKEDDIRRAREAREGFERTFLRPGAKVIRVSGQSE